MQEFYTHQGECFHRFSEQMPEVVSRNMLELRNREFGITEVEVRCVVILGHALEVTDRDLIRTVIFFETRLFVQSNIATRFVISITIMYVCIVFVSITMCMHRIFAYLMI